MTRKKAPCPICGGKVDGEGNRFHPFCSNRCKVIDLGKWLSGDYAIPAVSEDGELETIPVDSGEDGNGVH